MISGIHVAILFLIFLNDFYSFQLFYTRTHSDAIISFLVLLIDKSLSADDRSEFNSSSLLTCEKNPLSIKFVKRVKYYRYYSSRKKCDTNNTIQNCIYFRIKKNNELSKVLKQKYLLKMSVLGSSYRWCFTNNPV